MYKAEHINFKGIGQNDLPIVTKWFRATNVSWYGKEFTDQNNCSLVLYKKMPIGLAKMSPVATFPEYSPFVPNDFCGLDLLLSQTGFSGLADKIIHKLLTEVVFGQNQFSGCFVDPEPNNKTAISAFQKAGFIGEKNIKLPESQTLGYLMTIAKG